MFLSSSLFSDYLGNISLLSDHLENTENPKEGDKNSNSSIVNILVIVFFFFFKFFYLAVLGLSCGAQDLYLWHAGSSSLTRG